MKISIIGAGYVGLSLALLIARKYQVSLLDINSEKISLLKKKISPIKDPEVQKFLKLKNKKFIPTSNLKEAIENSYFTIIATPTNYDIKSGTFDTSSVEQVIKQVKKHAPNSYIIIKSTVPIGFTQKMKSKHKTDKISFSPEFLREGSALYDNLYPSRIIIGDNNRYTKRFASILAKCSNVKEKNNFIHLIDSTEAEAVKLFSNTFLAMRVSYFNELDSFAQIQKLSTKNIIDGVSSDPRIGNHYNNPSFGYGGYCLPKDTKQLLQNFKGTPNNIIKAIIESNDTRKKFIAKDIISKKPKSVGVYRLVMKSNSDNFRESAILDVVKILQKKNIKIYLFEPTITNDFGSMVLIKDFKEFVKKADVIIANRFTSQLQDIADKVYSRDIFGEN